MLTIRDRYLVSREWSLEIRNPLSQPGMVWATLSSTELAKAQDALRLRRVDPGNIFKLSEELLGSVTKWAVLGDNVIGVWGWRGVSLADQYKAVNTGAGAFIAAAMCYLRVSGSDAAALLDMLSPRRVSDLPVNGAKFIVFTTPVGTVDEEAVVIRTGLNEFVMSCGGGKPPGWLALMANKFDDVIIQPSDVLSFNIKGPQRLAAVQSLVQESSRDQITELSSFQSCKVKTLVGGEARILKSIIGYEVWAASDVLAEVWKQLVVDRPAIVPCGWELLSIYRMECRSILFTLFPVDMHMGTTLYEIDAGWMVPKIDDGREYIGRAALTQERSPNKTWLAGVRAVDDTVEPPLIGSEVFTRLGEFAGYITSAAFSPREKRVLGFAHLSPNCSVGSKVLIDGANWDVCSVPFNGRE